jgi:hypothetical protein
MDWRGWPLTSHEIVVDLIAATTTRTGLKVHAELDEAPTQRRQGHRSAMAALPLFTHGFHGVELHFHPEPLHKSQLCNTLDL